MSTGQLLSLLAIVAGSWAIASLVRRLEDVSWKIVAVVIAATLLFMFEPLFLGGIPVPLDEVARGYPYRGITGVADSLNPDANDTAKQMLPWMQVVREEMFAGRAPLWNQWAFSGYPLLGNAQSAPFYPLFLGTLWVPLPDQIVAMSGLKVFVALLFGFLLIRREKVGDGVALFGSAVFALSMFTTVYLYYPLGSTVAFVPAAAWAVLRCLDSPGVGSIVAVALSVGALQAAGHPETVFHAAVVVGLLLVVELVAPARSSVERRTFPGLVAMGVGLLLGLLVSAPAWLPVLELVLESQRVQQIGAGEFGGAVYPSDLLWIYLNPTGYGHPVRETWSWITIYPMVASSYLGLLTLSLLPSSLLSPRAGWRDRLLLAGGVVLTLIAMNWTFVGPMFERLFPWIAHDRIRFGAVLLFGIAAARVVERFKERQWILPLMGAVLALSGALYVLIQKWGVTQEPRDTVGVAALILFWLVAAVVLVARREDRGAGVIGWTAFALIAVELTLFGTEYNPPVPARLFAPELPIIEAVREAAPDEPFRIVGTDWAFLPNSAAQYGLEDVRGSDPMAWGPYTRFLETFDVDDGATDIQRIRDLRAPQLDFLNVAFALSEPGWTGAPGWEAIYQGVDGMVWRNLEVLPRAFMPTTVSKVQSEELARELESVEDFSKRVLVEGARRETIENEGAAALWIGRMSPVSYRIRTEPARSRRFVATSLPALNGWTVEADGEALDVELVNGAFVGFFLPGGAETARIRYRPAVWRWALGLFAGGLVAAAGIGRWWPREGSSGKKPRSGIAG